MANIHVHSDRSFREQQIKHEDETREAVLEQIVLDSDIEAGL